MFYFTGGHPISEILLEMDSSLNLVYRLQTRRHTKHKSYIFTTLMTNKDNSKF